MKTIERQIRNHEFMIRLVQEDDPPSFACLSTYTVDGTNVHRDEFLAAVALLSAEAPK